MRKMFATFFSRTIALLTGALLTTSAVLAAEVRIISSPGASSALNEIAPRFERSAGHAMRMSFANIAALKTRMAEGEAFDITIVSPALIDELLQQGKIVAGTRFNIGRTGLGVAVRNGARKPDIASVDAFRSTMLGANTVAYSATGESGIAFLAALDRLGIAAEMKSKVRPSATLGKDLQAGVADVGVSGIGAILATSSVDYAGPLPSQIQAYVNFTGGISTNAKEPEAARALIKFLNEPDIVTILKAKGLEPF